MTPRMLVAMGLAAFGLVFFFYSFAGQQQFRLVRTSDVYVVGEQVHTYPEGFKVDGWIRYSEQETLDSLVHFFKKFDEMCQAEGLDYWPTSGSILGVWRHKGIIPWDDDLDFAMTRESAERLMKMSEDGTLLKKYNFEFDPGVVVVTKLKFADQGWFPSADIYIVEEVDEAFRYCLPLYLNGSCTFIGSDWWPREYFFRDDLYPLRRVEYEDFYVNAPNNFQKVVTQMWGEDALHEGPESSLYSIHTAYTMMKPLVKSYYLLHTDHSPFFLTPEAKERMKFGQKVLAREEREKLYA